MQENHMGWELLWGVRQDVTKLFKQFAKTNSVRYEDFCKVWKEMNFSLIFSNRTLFIEMLEFCEELLQIVKEYLSSVYEFHTRVAALYTLYGLYFKQPVSGAAKIRFTKSEWEDLQSFITDCKTGKHFDVAFIHYKLYLNGAYTFAVTVRHTGPEKGFQKYSRKKWVTLPSSCDIDMLHRPLISEQLVNSLIQLESLYCKKKSELLGKQNLVFIDGTFAKTLQEDLKNYSVSKQNIRTVEIDGAGSNEDVEKQRTSNDVASEKPNKGSKRKNEGKELNDDVKSDRKQRLGSKYLDMLAKKKAEYYIKKLREDCFGVEDMEESKNFELPDLNFS